MLGVTVDGERVWAVVPGREESQTLVVLECTTGTLVSQASLLEGRHASPNVVLHPDGRHVGPTFIEPDLCTSFWAHLQPDSSIEHWEIQSDEEVTIGIAPTGERIVTANLQGHFIG